MKTMKMPSNVRHVSIPDYSTVYPTAWKEGYRRGRKGYNDGLELSQVSTRCRYKDFWQRMAFKMGIADGFNTEQELFYDAIL